MSGVDVAIGHRAVIEGLWRAQDRGRLAHALLFEGPAGIGKFRAAQWFAQGLYCETRGGASDWDGPCGNCGGCKRFLSGSHADVYVLDPIELEMESIKVAAIAERGSGEDSVCGFFRLRAMEGGVRTVIVREFERAEISAQNALLKTLEEPGEGALLILETSRADLLLETIRSRCVTVRFNSLSDEDCAQVLAHQGSAGTAAEPLVGWAGGSPGRAMAMASEAAPEVRAILERMLRDELDPYQATALVLQAPGEFAGKTPTAQLRARTRAAVDLYLAVLRDGMRALQGVDPAQLAHGDLAPLALNQGTAWARAMDVLVALRGEVELNLSPEGVLDRAFLAMPRPMVASRGGRG